MQNITHYIPILTTIISFSFTSVLYKHWRYKPEAKYLMWWTIGACCFGIGTLTESINALAGWSVLNMKAWYISGALLGAFPLATRDGVSVVQKENRRYFGMVLHCLYCDCSSCHYPRASGHVHC